MHKEMVLCSILILVGGTNACAGAVESKSVMSLFAVLKAAENFSPRLEGANLDEQAAQGEIVSQLSNYYPELSVATVASTGDPGTFALMDVDGGISSSQRLGIGGALVMKQNVWDFGRTSHRVETARASKDALHKRVDALRVEVDQNVLSTYIECAFLRAEISEAKTAAATARMLAKETNRFVQSGQRSIVERYLVDAEAQEAETRIAEVGERLKGTELRLGIEVGKGTGASIQCLDLDQLDSELDLLESKSGPNPLLELQQSRLQIARSRFDEAKAEFRPSLFAMATVGYFDNDRLSSRTNYSAGIGIRFPLFEGFRLEAIERERASQVRAEESYLTLSKLVTDRHNSVYDEKIRSLRVRLESLVSERRLAHKVFDLARRRYLNLQGTMLDLKESIRNLNRVVQSTEEAYRDLYSARAERALTNGSRPF